MPGAYSIGHLFFWSNKTARTQLQKLIIAESAGAGGSPSV
jgi:hypothetical protein